MWISYKETVIEVSLTKYVLETFLIHISFIIDREAFERNSRAVELSPEHVPDINVITGVLKDYLRELPEPLFTKCLFQMTVDALGKDFFNNDLPCDNHVLALFK